MNSGAVPGPGASRPGSPRDSRSAPRAPHGSRPAPREARPAPLDRGRAGGLLAGRVAFTAGLAVAAVLVLTGSGSTPPYYVAITVGLVGIGLTGYFYQRGAAALPAGRIWSPAVLRAVISSLDLPVVPVIAVLYGLAAVGLLGNLVVPLISRR